MKPDKFKIKKHEEWLNKLDMKYNHNRPGTGKKIKKKKKK